MQTTSTLYKKLFNAIGKTSRFEVRCFVANQEITEAQLPEVRVYGNLYPAEPVLGGVVSREIELYIDQAGLYPRAGELRPQVRLTDGVDTSEWIPKGTFYIYERKRELYTNRMYLHGFDAIAKLEKFFYRCLPVDYEQTFSWSSTDTMAAIANWLGVQIDSRSNIRECQIYDPAADAEPDPENPDTSWHGLKKADLILCTMRQVAGWIAAASGGTWIMTDEGKLRLIPAGQYTNDLQNIGPEAGSFWKESDYNASWTGVSLTYSGMADAAAGNNTGRILTGECPFATSAMAASILGNIGRLYYTPYEAGDVLMDPAMEPGDVLFIGLLDEAEYPLIVTNVDMQLGGLNLSSLSSGENSEFSREFTAEDVSANLIIRYMYGDKEISRAVYVFPDGYVYNLPNPYLDLSGDGHRYIYIPQNAAAEGTVDGETIDEQPYGIAIDNDTQEGTVFIYSADKLTVSGPDAYGNIEVIIA